MSPVGAAQELADRPGHTDGSIAAVGQVMLGVLNTDRTRAIASCRRLATLAPDTVCFGHGDPLTENAA
ncbi:hypothetical protein [Streptomyces beijiangensis]|uniref:hypothetical protein n=1 Tax=Streptomyces beijiangensis TaxID=163361 RepID=UPI0027DB2831|nr:hypothetical protein [Streptomyces beijiangensis]